MVKLKSYFLLLILAVNINDSKKGKNSTRKVYKDTYEEFELNEVNVNEFTTTEDITETETETTESTDTVVDVLDHTEVLENDITEVCPQYKDVGGIDLELMVDVWEPVYSQLSNKIPCFKMLIRKVTTKEKNRYAQQYGDFNEGVVWDECHLEVKSSSSAVSRKHFLQTCDKNHGILENIIIEQDNSSVHLVEENPDQWLLVENLLLLRDCFTGEVVVFAKVPYQPKLEAIKAALSIFGNLTDGDWACNDSYNSVKKQAFDDEEDFDSDVVHFD